MQTIFLSDSKNSTKLSNAFLQDNGLSWEARGLLAYILSSPPDWRISLTSLIEATLAGSTRVRRIVQELIMARYLRRVEVRASAGRFDGWVYIASDDPTEIAGINTLQDAQKKHASKRSARKRSREKTKRLDSYGHVFVVDDLGEAMVLLEEHGLLRKFN